MKNSYFHEEFTVFASLPKNRFSREILVGKLEASKKPAKGQEEASKKPARSQHEASKRPAKASKRPGRGQEGSPNGGGLTKHRNRFREHSQKLIF